MDRGINTTQAARPARTEPGDDGTAVRGEQLGLVDVDEALCERPGEGRVRRDGARLGGSGDRRVGGRDDLGAVPNVNLVAVVGRRVVTGGDHDPCRRLKVAHSECRDRRRQGAHEPPRPQAAGRHYPGRVVGQLRRTMPSVMAHDHADGSRSGGG